MQRGNAGFESIISLWAGLAAFIAIGSTKVATRGAVARGALGKTVCCSESTLFHLHLYSLPPLQLDRVDEALHAQAVSYNRWTETLAQSA